MLAFITFFFKHSKRFLKHLPSAAVELHTGKEQSQSHTEQRQAGSLSIAQTRALDAALQMLGVRPTPRIWRPQDKGSLTSLLPGVGGMAAKCPFYLGGPPWN